MTPTAKEYRMLKDLNRRFYDKFLTRGGCKTDEERDKILCYYFETSRKLLEVEEPKPR